MKIFTLILLFFCFISSAQSIWPSEDWNSAVNLTSVMDSNGITDLSGLHWNPANNRLYCVQGNGRLRVLQLNTATNTFSQIANRSVPDGPEGITQVDYSANTFYTIDENNYEIRKYNHTANFSNVILSRSWNLLNAPSPMQDTGNNGPEGIVFIPDNFLNASGFISTVTGMPYISLKGMGGLMFIAHQEEGYIWVFDVNPNVTDDFAYVGKYKTGRSESCDLAFDRSTGMLYILHNIPGQNTIEVTDLQTSSINGEEAFSTFAEYNVTIPLQNDNIEGFAIAPKCPGSGTVNAWLCRDVETNEDDAVQQDALRWFNPYTADGSCLLGVESMTDEKITVFPNPAKETLYISGVANGAHRIKIFNILGQPVLETKVENELVSLDISLFESGIYLIEISQNGNVFRTKIIKE